MIPSITIILEIVTCPSINVSSKQILTISKYLNLNLLYLDMWSFVKTFLKSVLNTFIKPLSRRNQEKGEEQVCAGRWGHVLATNLAILFFKQKVQFSRCTELKFSEIVVFPQTEVLATPMEVGLVLD